MKIIIAVGARPNFMKVAPLFEKLKENKIEYLLVHTGQHYDEKMSDLFFKQLNIPEPDIFLGIGSKSHAKQTAAIMEKFDDICNEKKPDALLVVGDVNSTLACSVVAVKYGIKIIHLEAGLRSYDRKMPEEINRILTDAITDYYLTPSRDANKNLLKEGVNKKKIYCVGNIMIDTLYNFLPIIEKSDILNKLNLSPKSYILMTLHRPSNVDNKENLSNIYNTLKKIDKNYKIIFPVHPRTMNNLKKFEIISNSHNDDRILLLDPLGYLDFQKLLYNAKVLITDSGGVQEETTALKVPCITLRENTERPITVSKGSNVLIGNDMDKFLNYIEKAINNKWKKSKIPKLWDGNTADRVLKVLKII